MNDDKSFNILSKVKENHFEKPQVNVLPFKHFSNLRPYSIYLKPQEIIIFIPDVHNATPLKSFK